MNIAMKVQTQIKKPSVGREPGYAKDTSALKVKRALARNDLGFLNNTISKPVEYDM
jgi:hypothetical protein